MNGTDGCFSVSRQFKSFSKGGIISVYATNVVIRTGNICFRQEQFVMSDMLATMSVTSSFPKIPTFTMSENESVDLEFVTVNRGL